MQILNAALQQAHSNHVESTASPQLRQAANQFEASFLQELLKPMSDDSMFGSGSDGDSSGSMGTVSSIAAQALADGIAKDGGLGIAKRVLAELAPVEAKESGSASKTAAQCGGCAPHLQPADGGGRKQIVQKLKARVTIAPLLLFFLSFPSGNLLRPSFQSAERNWQWASRGRIG